MNLTPDERYDVQHKLQGYDDLRGDVKEVSENVKKLTSVTRALLGRVREHDLRLTKLELSEKALTEHMDDMRVLVTNARDDIRKASARFEHFDNKLDAHVISENIMQKRILAWVIATLMMCMIGISGWILDYVLKP
jgi:chromosome segregation ATPase